VYACVLVRALPGKVRAALEGIRKMENVVRAFPVLGRYDIVAFVEALDFKAVNEASERINAVKGVKSTETAIEG